MLRGEAAADTTSLQQQLSGSLAAASGAADRQGQIKAVEVEGQAQRATLQVGRHAQRAVLQEASNSTTHLAVAEATLPLADEVGELYMYTAGDIRAIAPLWWTYTSQMRVFHETRAQVTPVTSVNPPWGL